jgi:CRP-like cAMP-binding protein
VFDNEILFSQGDLSDLIYFVFKGNIVLLTDLSELVDMSLHLKPFVSFNVPLCHFIDGSFLGDNEVLLCK